MKRNALNLFVLATFGILALSCSNKELEKRVATLEGQVAELKGESSPEVYPEDIPEEPEPEVKPDGPLPAFDFNEKEHDFGTIKEGDVVDHTFTFKNTGDAPLIISAATGSCGCTVPDWPKEPIGVGKEAKIDVSFNSKGKPGIQNKSVTITANTYPKITRLKIKANVVGAEDPS